MILLINLLAGLEIWWDFRLIERKKRRPNYRGSNWLRVAVGLVVWIAWPLMFHMEHSRWLFSPVMMFSNFWFVFDYGLNYARSKDFDHLGTNRIDTFQKKHGGERVWFWVKLGLMVVSWGIYIFIL